MEPLIIQLDKRHGRLSEFVKSSGEIVTLGRGFNNDIILSDHFIAPEQIRFDYDGEHWNISLLDDTNPVLLNGKQITEDGAKINSGDQLTVGRTHLVLLLSHHPVEHTRKLMLSNWMYHHWLRQILPVFMLFVSAILAIFTEYQELTGRIRWGELVAAGLVYILIIIFWAGCWALVGRLLRHQPNFFAQLFYTALLMAGLNVGMLFYGYVEYATTNTIMGQIVEWGFLLLVLSLLLKFNLSYASELKSRSWVSVSVVAVSLLFVFSMSYLGQRDFSTRPDYSDTLKPPLAKWSSDMSIDAYMRDVASQFDELEEKLKKD